MRRIALIFAAIVALTATAHGGSMSLLGAGKPVAGASYTGPGDVVSGALVFVGLQAYNAAYNGNAANVCLPSSATCADVTVSGNTLTIPGTLSTCNNSTVICTIKTLYDQSGANSCGGSPCNFVRIGTQSGDPVFVVAGASNGCPNTALPCISFNGTSQYLRAGAGNFTRAQAYSATAVAERTSGTSQSTVIGSFNAGFLYGFGFGANTARINPGAAFQKTSVNDNAWHAIQYVFNGASSEIDADGAGTGAQAGGSTNLSSDYLYIGFENSLYYLTGFIAEAGIWPGAFSSGNISSLNTNAHSAGRWNF